MSEALVSALGAARSRLEADLAVAEAELAAARERCRILRQSLAVARNEAVTRAAASVAAAVSAIAIDRPAPLRRGDPSRAATVFSPHAILRWEGDHPFAGTFTGEPQVVTLLTDIAALVVLGSIRAEQLAMIEHGVDVLVRLSFAAPTVAEPLDTRLACRFRFDDLGRIDFCVVMGEDPAEADAFFRAAVTDVD